jgi:methyltransferase (TIGR00027 family)
LSTIAPLKNRILDDPLALKMLPWPWTWGELFFALPFLKSFSYHLGSAISNILAGYRGNIEMVALRYRHIDDRLLYYMNQGFRQVLLLGAGFDYRAHRPEFRDLNFIEVDHPKTQEEKLRIIRSASSAVNKQVKYLAVDFHDDWAPQLEKSGMVNPEPTVVIWEGVSYYLRREAVHYTLNSIRGFVASGSVLIFDSLPPVQSAGAMQSKELHAAADYVAKKGEPLLWGGTVAEVRQLLALYSYLEKDIQFISSITEMLNEKEGLKIIQELIFKQMFVVEAEV